VVGALGLTLWSQMLDRRATTEALATC